ncbi:putative selenate reductase [Lachnospiraceae bacterium PF1-22]|uniref:putative selenate reductase subunit YgfK n=1 Tax=Ohessyouella blattaphilus TaxID=2949333 RepID=UPI003E2678D0
MSDIMSCMPFEQLLNWVRKEHKEKQTVFGLHKAYVASKDQEMHIFGRPLETPIGPAAGPNSQLAQNIVASYYAGSRFFELKTVQIMDGAELAACVNKPCIKADDEGYNCEWSTELYVPQAQDEYIKAWFLLKFMAKEYGLGEMDGFQFNISVGYDLAGVKSEKINTFIDNMKDGKNTDVFKECQSVLLKYADEFANFTAQDAQSVPGEICNSATISTLHGCPPEEIESIACYLLEEKGLHTFVKCNPTLLGYDFARARLNELGYDYIAFGPFHFEDDLQYEDAVPMFKRLMKLSGELGLEFGVKITNTFPVDVKAGELPSEEMYMSGKSLFPLSISLAAKLSEEFDGGLRISYAGGADAFNIKEIVSCGVWPVTVATTILKPGGYQRLTQMANLVAPLGIKEFNGIDVKALRALAEAARSDKHYMKSAKLPGTRKSKESVPLIDCYMAPCEEGCPINQEVATYMKLSGEGRYEEALRVILNRNALPFITGTICNHNCQSRCTRNFYETPVQIRDTKLLCAENAFAKVKGEVKAIVQTKDKVAIVGGGPAGMAAAYYLARSGAEVVLYEKKERLGGVVSQVIPNFRIDDQVIAKDAELLTQLGVTLHLGTVAPKVDELEKDFDRVILAVGAYKRGSLPLEGCETKNALDFLEAYNQNDGKVSLGRNVVVIGGGNTAMDTARAAKRCPGVENVYLVYRRTKRYMPADEHELVLAREEGVEFKELLAPVKLEGGELLCKVMELGDVDSSGRPCCVEGEGTEAVQADTVIVAVGEKVPTDFYKENGLEVDERGYARTGDNYESSRKGVYVIGDGRRGPALVVSGMADALKVAEDIVGADVCLDLSETADEQVTYEKQGVLKEVVKDQDGKRCLSCQAICENCVQVCPNRANLAIQVPGMEKTQVIHVDYMCNECGNCASFCPYASSPYLDKFTLFANLEHMKDSKNQGFVVLDRELKQARVRLLGKEFTWQKGEASAVPEAIANLMEAVIDDYAYVLDFK